jgi:hypothetical protein
MPAKRGPRRKPLRAALPIARILEDAEQLVTVWNDLQVPDEDGDGPCGSR